MANNPAPMAQDSLEDISCLLCNSREHQAIFKLKDRLETAGPGGTALFQLVACSACGFRFLSPRPRPEDLPKYYPRETYSPHQRKGGGAVGLIYRLLRPFSIGYKARRAAGGLHPGAILDVGCGTGEFLVEMQRRGWQTWGIEKEESAARIARDSGSRVLIGDPAEVDLANQKFELITLWHALEHLPDPKEALEKLTTHLKPGGRLLIALPNPDSLDARFYGSHWAAWDAPRHLYHFRPSDLQKLIKKTSQDYRRIGTFSLPLDPLYHSLLSEISWSRGLTALIRSARGMFVGLMSFCAGFSPQRGSSILYVYEKS